MQTKKYEAQSDIVSTNKDGINTEFLINGQWIFSLPYSLEYEVNGEIEDMHDVDVRDLVLWEPDSEYHVPFYAAVNEHQPILPEYMTAIDCKYDNRFAGNTGDGLHEIITDTPELYVDLVSVNMWPLGLDMEVRVRGESITPFDIHKMVNAQSQENADHIYGIFKEIAQSIQLNPEFLENNNASTKATGKKQQSSISDPNCIMDGTVLLKYIGQEADIVLPEGIKELSDMIFSDRDELHSVVIPESVTVIGRRAFENCFSLEKVVLPKALKSLGGYAFVDCHELKSISLSSKLKIIEDSAFSDCYALENVVIPKSVKCIDGFAFYKCYSFTKIILPEGLETIGWSSFAGCINLEYIYIPSTVTEIIMHPAGGTPFEACEKLTIHCLADSYAEQFANENGIPCVIEAEPPKAPRNKQTSSNTPASPAKKAVPAKKTPSSAAPKTVLPANFPKCKLLSLSDLSMDDTEITGCFSDETQIMLPDGVTKIGNYAFSYKENLKAIVIPEGVTQIKSAAFEGCKALESIALPSSLKEIGKWAFYECENLSEIHIPDGVTQIGDSAFFGCKSLKSTVLPSSLKEIGEMAFYKCNNLESITFSPELEKINDTAFQSCDALINIFIPDGVTAIGESAFEGCAELLDIFIPNSVVSIGENAFCTYNPDLIIHVTSESYAETYCKNKHLKYDYLLPKNYTPRAPRSVSEVSTESEFEIDGDVLIKYTGNAKVVTVPEQVKTIGNSAFTYNKVMEKAILPKGLLAVEKSAFHGCENLRKINLPRSITKLPSFTNCLKLQTVIIPQGIKTVSYEFLFCAGLTDLYIPDTVSEIEQNAFSECEQITLHVPSGSFAESYAVKNALPYDNDVGGIWE